MAAAGHITIVGLGPAGGELISAETLEFLKGSDPVWLRTAVHPAADSLEFEGSFDGLYESLGSFDEVYETIIERLVLLSGEHGRVVYGVPGSPSVAERTVEMLRSDERVDVDIRPAMSFLDLCWNALGIDPMAQAVTIVDGHRIAVDTAGSTGPFLVTQVHSSDVLDDITLALDDVAPETATLLQGLGTSNEVVKTIAWGELGRTVEPDHLTSLWVPQLAEPVAAAFVRFDELVRRLRNECPWDAEQTHASLRRFLLEEAYEVLEAIDSVTAGDEDGYVDLEEELGDLLFQVFFHSRLAAEAGAFTVADVAQGIHDKLHGRHPHVFGDADASDTIANWEASKQIEKARSSVMDGIPTALPALLHALKVQKRAASAGFSLTRRHFRSTTADLGRESRALETALGDVADELAEVTADPTEHEVGDLLYAAVQVARMLDVDPESALRGASSRFVERFRIVEAGAAADGVSLADEPHEQLQQRWAQAKSQLTDFSGSDSR